ncbi:family 1 glycosylhydrolase [Paracoccus benzoatiresistens]|uniref:dTDP-4-dehydrorhamnose reductase n=1 Tax=Paracoccus benzoatiresistens TaxID=2997341 RepID=A0ABT4JBQ0_9RHOB|nr:family 1 glycosylhydrolase [Paracoccus sp. EF6]MCZ0963758.1 sugar nucleotide-binding protein [Paracoccus sp. EF6]
MLPSVRGARAISDLQLWGGCEYTLNRVGDRFFDQTRWSGHHERVSDLRLFADLGLRALRYPVLWERVSPQRPEERDFAWSDERLAEIRRLGLRPILGLVHHGSGPAYTSLVAGDFASGLAAHAGAVAERYPWIEDWTPVNEPLTTARFACLYGHWYPHTQDEDACWLALLNQIDATRAAMAAIRRVIPGARLVQTEDLGFCHALPHLAAEAAFENDRRWLTWDLLCGAVLPGHPLWPRLAARGFEVRLRAIADDPCPPDIIGINHYLTSERFLDDRFDLYPGIGPSAESGGRFVNVEAVRTVPGAMAGVQALLAQAWKRYGRTVAITECHNGCTREEQLRWFLQVWQAARAAREGGADVAAVTAWALLGSFNWDRLVTAERGRYECGVYDLRGGVPRPTAMAALLGALAAGADPPRPDLLALPGWWDRDDRLWASARPPAGPQAATASDQTRTAPDARPILITGRSGTLGRMFARLCRLRGLPHVLTDRQGLAIDDPASVAAALDRLAPWAIINTAGMVSIEGAETDPEACFAANAEGPANLARACRSRGIAVVTFSSDQVFDGEKGTAYVEGDPIGPLNTYGRSKAEAERLVLDIDPDALVVRTAAFFSPHDVHNFAVHAIDALRAHQPFAAAGDNVVSPTYVPDLVNAVLDLLLDGESGIRHLASQGRLSWADFARALAAADGLDPDAVLPVEAARLGWRAPRPADVTLATDCGQLLPEIDDAIARFLRDYHPAGTPPEGRA